MISNMTRTIAHVANRNFKPAGQKSFKRETKKYLQSKAATTDLLGEPLEKCPMEDPIKKCPMEDPREFYRRSVNKRWNHWAMTDLEPLPRRTVVNKFKKNKGLLFKRGQKYETSMVNKRAMHMAVQRERALKYDETPYDLQDTRLMEEEDAYWSVVPSYYAAKWVSEIEMDILEDGYDCVENWFENYWYNSYHAVLFPEYYVTTAHRIVDELD
jgi:hypothetical protein